MDANSDIKRITNTLDNLKQRHIGQYLEYITEFCQKEYKWDQTKTEAVLEHAIQAGFVYTAPSNNKISYRIKSQGIIIQDNVKSVETQTEPTTVTDDREFVNIQNDLQEFKRFAHSEILSLKAQTSNGNHTEKNVKIERDDTYLKPLLRSFEQRITSLEKQLEDKQRIIEALIRGPSPYVNKPDHCKEASPMGERGEYADKSKELKTKEAKNIDDNRLKEPPKNPDSKRDNGVIEDPNKQTRTQEKETTAVARNSKRQNEKESKKDDKKQNERKNVVIIGDSILNGLSEQGLRKQHNVRIRAHSGATSLDIKDHIRPIMRRKPDCVLVHCGTNDLTNKDGIDTIETIKEIISEAKDESPHTTIVLSSLTMRRDHEGMSNKVNELNRSLKKLANEQGIPIIDNNNIDISCLSARKLHLNRKGDSTLARNFVKFLDNF